MAKATKEFEWRMQGMLAAHKIVKEGGLEALDKEIRMRNFLKVDLWAKKGEVEALHKTISENVYTSMLMTMMFVLHDTFKFGKKRLDRLREDFDKKVKNISNLDWLGNHYVRFEDYGVYLNERYGYEFDVDKIAAIQDLQDEEDKRVRRCDVDRLVIELKKNGFEDAAEWLEKKVS